ncbi:hypothetical protein [Actinoplanes sp. NPDC049599]|uniref:hypothetical protein n=1 Tax=Actinoplanes sp. NPDC049599 TaxID=3363903 RepID=UPI003794C38C
MHPIRTLSVTLTATALVVVVSAAPVTPAAAAAPPPAGTGRLIALGSLGGGQSWAERMNARGDLIGGTTDAADTWHAAVWWHGRSAPTALGVDRASPTAINDRGHIAGQLWDGGLFLWRRGAVTRQSSPAGTSLEAVAVNNRDQVVGTAYDQDGATRAFLWQRGQLTMLSTPAAADSSAVGINNHGQIVGVVTPRETAAEQAVLWQRGRLTGLGTLGGPASTPVAINDRGQVAGNSTVQGSAADHPFRWQRGRMTDLLAGTTATSGRAYALSGTGLVAGSASGSTGESRPVLWRAGRMTDVGLPGHVGLATAVNDRGDVAGPTWADPQGLAVPFRRQDGRTTLFPEPTGDIAIRVVGIDQHGTIAVALETTSSGLTLLRSAPKGEPVR